MYSTEGIVLKKQDSGEADALFTIYTKDFGKIRALAKGVKKDNAKLKGHLEPLNLSSISFVLGKNGERLTNAVMLNHWPKIRENPAKLYAAHIIADLVDAQCFPGQKDAKMWQLILGGFVILEEGGFQQNDSKKFLDGFHKSLFSVLGHGEVSENAILGYDQGHAQ